jgi:hypothetical protein
MLKNILNLEGAQKLTKNEQKIIKGGIPVGCYFISYPGDSLANCRLEYPNASYNATTHTCRALVCEDNSF